MRHLYFLSGLSAALLLLCSGASAQELEEVFISIRNDTRTINVSEALSISPDAAQLLHDAPGANVTANGPITGIPQYRGLFGPRIAVSLDGNLLSPAGPNWMDPPISYAVTAQLETLEVYRGIAPVSVALESLGGVIDAQTRRMDFGNSDSFAIEGRAGGNLQSINSGYQLDADIQASNRNQRFKIAAMLQDGDDAHFPGGDILPSSYKRERYDLGYGARWGDHSIQFDYGYNETGDSGTPALPMDIAYIEGDLYNVTYRYDPKGNLELLAAIYGSKLEHGMSNYHLRPSPISPANWRQNIADTSNIGFKLQASLTVDNDLWRFGIDSYSEEHDSNIDNPNNPMFFVVNFNAAKRKLLGAYIESEHSFSDRLRGDVGVRVNRVQTDAGEVNGTPAMMMPPAQALRDAFNTAGRDRSETNVDLVAKLNYKLNDRLSLYAGIAQKQRGPSYQERYLWLPLEATAGLADGQLYIGNVDLDSELARKLEFGFDYRNERFGMYPRVFYTRIDDYIQGTRLSAEGPATGMVRMMNMANGADRTDPLQFNNVDAQLYGFDMDWSLQLSDRFELSGLLNYVRGERRDINDDLYRIAPPNMTLRIGYERGRISTVVEAVAYAAQNDVSETSREQVSSGYTTINLRGSWQLSSDLQLSLGVDNLFDRDYAPHLGGYNRVRNPDIAVAERLPAQGTNVFGRVMYTF